MDCKWLGPYVISKDLSKVFFSLRSTESGKEVQRIHGAHLKQYVTPPNPVSIDDQESSSESPNLSIDSPPLLPLPSDVDQSEDDEFDTSIDSIPPLPPSIAHQVCNDSTLPDAQPTISNYTDPAQRFSEVL